MKKLIILTTLFIFGGITFIKAQTTTLVTSLHSGGEQEMKVKDASGQVFTINGNSIAAIQSRYLNLVVQKSQPLTSSANPVPQQLFVSHQAVLLKNGDQEIRWKDETGRERVVTASKGESIQEKYLAYLKKEGISCGCSPVNTQPSSTPQISTLNSVKTATENK